MTTPTKIWIVFRWYSDGSGEPEFITAIPDEVTALALKATHKASYGNIQVEECPVWPDVQKTQ